MKNKDKDLLTILTIVGIAFILIALLYLFTKGHTKTLDGEMKVSKGFVVNFSDLEVKPQGYDKNYVIIDASITNKSGIRTSVLKSSCTTDKCNASFGDYSEPQDFRLKAPNNIYCQDEPYYYQDSSSESLFYVDSEIFEIDETQAGRLVFSCPRTDGEYTLSFSNSKYKFDLK